ncbi:MAG: hypothetical protein ACRDJH_02550 [Thermomicrobiales bacterium]
MSHLQIDSRPVPHETPLPMVAVAAQSAWTVDPLAPVAPAPMVNVTTNVAAPTVHLSVQSRQLPFLLRALWFVFVGWWLSVFFITVGYLFLLLVVTIPFGLYLLHRVPQVQTLRQRTASFKTEYRDGAVYFTEGTQPQYPWYARAVYFVFVGWWLAAFWLTTAWLISLLVITLPLSAWMIDRTPGVLTLQRH